MTTSRTGPKFAFVGIFGAENGEWRIWLFSFLVENNISADKKGSVEFQDLAHSCGLCF